MVLCNFISPSGPAQGARVAEGLSASLRVRFAGTGGNDLPHLYDFKVTPVELLQLMQLIVAPSSVRRATQIERRTVVREQHAVLLKRREDHLEPGREGSEVGAGLESNAHPHRRERYVGLRTCPMARRSDVGLTCHRTGEAECVVDGAELHDF